MATPSPGRRAPVPGWAPRFSFLPYRPLALFLLAAAFALVPLVLGYIGLHEYLFSRPAGMKYGRSWWDILFYDLQLPVLSSAPAQDAGPYPVSLGIARLLAPAVAGLAALAPPPL